MCEMEVRPGQLTSTILQAMAHNTSTIDRDLDMLREVLKARGQDDLLESVQSAQWDINRAYETFLHAFGHAVQMLHNGGVHTHDDPIGNEREIEDIVVQAHHDAQLARKFMTR